MPFPNQHAAVVTAASKFDQKTFRTINIGDKDSGITAIVGRKKGEKATTVHSYRFDKKKFTPAQSKKWLKDHDITVIEFEPASEKASDDNTDNNVMDDNNYFNQIPEDLVYKTFHLDICETKEDEQLGVFRGAMATEHKDRGNDIIAPEAFDNTLKRYKKAKRPITLYYQHNTFALPIGIIGIKSVIKDGKDWNVRGELNLDTQKGQEVYSLMKQGALSDLSIGFTIVAQDIKTDKKDPEKYTRIIKELELWEVSVVGEPMNPKAKISEIKNGLSPDDDDGTTAISRMGKLTDDGEYKIHDDYKEKINIEEVEHIETKKEFNEVLSKSGVFSRSACEFLASCFSPKIDQSKSAGDSKDESKEKDPIEDEINSELKNAELFKLIDDRVIIHKLDGLLKVLN